MHKHTNPCSRCGKERVLYKTYEEDLGFSTVVTKEMVCPDESCQEKVDLDNKKRADKSAELKMRSNQRVLAKRAAKDAERIAAESNK